MSTNSQPDDEAMEFARSLLEDVAQLRMPELFSEKPPDAIFYLAGRNGVSVAVLRTPAFSEEQLTKLLEYRLAQYLSVGFVDPQKVYEARLYHEPASLVKPRDLHYIAGSSATGEILWRFTKAGSFDFSCLIPGHREAGMHGAVVVK